VLRVLGSLLGVPGFEFATAEEVRAEALKGTDAAARLNNAAAASGATRVAPAGVERIADVPIHFADALARRSEPLQLARDSVPPAARMSRHMLQRLGLHEGERVRVRQDGGEALLTAVEDDRVPAECVWIAAAHASTAALGDMFGGVTLERVPVGETVSA
jgi:NADH-quinone oxidoreductase subunit G